VHVRPRPLVLGSASPRRRELLSLAGVAVVVRSAEVDEAVHPGEKAEPYLERVTLAKLAAVRATLADAGDVAWVLVADTIVLAPEGSILGKPRDDAEARAMLARLAGATHEVRTRFLIAAARSDAPPRHAQTVATRVTMRALSEPEIAGYVESGEGRDKAGAYAAQGRAAAFVSRIDGSYTNVVGLPLCEVVVALDELARD
jgi:septum formation protein